MTDDMMNLRTLVQVWHSGKELFNFNALMKWNSVDAGICRQPSLRGQILSRNGRIGGQTRNASHRNMRSRRRLRHEGKHLWRNARE